MFKQRCLAFLESGCWEQLWNRFPEPARREVTQQCARLMARESIHRIQALKAKRETGHERR